MIAVAGCGSLGCELAKYLKTHMICSFRELTFVDFDTFQQHNLKNQSLAVCGEYKAKVLATYLAQHYRTNYMIKPVQDVQLSQFSLIFSLADSLEARKYCIFNGSNVIDVGVSADQFSIRCYSGSNSSFVNIFTDQLPRRCMVTKIETPEDLVQTQAMLNDNCDEIQLSCRRENVFYGFDCQFSIEFIRSVLKIQVQSSCLCQVAIQKAIQRGSQLLQQQQVRDLLIGTFCGTYFEEEYNFQNVVAEQQKVVVYQGRVVFWEEMGIIGQEDEISSGIIYHI